AQAIADLPGSPVGRRRAGSRSGKRRSTRDHAGQYESALSTSPWLREPRDHMTWSAVLDLMNLTDPSARPTLAPPEWKLCRPDRPSRSQSLLPLWNMQFGNCEFGARMVFPRACP